MGRGQGVEEWLFVIDTEQYSGNFEREMGAYLTGVLGPYFPGGSEDFAELYFNETGDKKGRSRFKVLLGEHEYDGEHEPDYVAIWPTPGWWNNGSGKHYRDEDFEKVQATRKKPVVKYTAYQSVALIFVSRPTDEQLDLLDKRARAFPEAHRADRGLRKASITVTGTRLVRKAISYSDVRKW